MTGTKTGQEKIRGLAISKDDVTIVLPVLNEENAVSEVIEEIIREGYRNIIIIDGYSTDLTVQAAQRHDVEVIPQHGKGKAGAVKTAIDNVSTPYLLIMDGDFTYDPADISRFLNHANGYDEIVGIRSAENIRPLHRLGNRLISGFFNTLFGTPVSDVCSGMYLLKSKSAKQMILRSRGFSIEVEILAQMATKGRVTEVPISYRKRIGQPKLSTWHHGLSIMKSILMLARLYNPVFLFSVGAAAAAIPGAAIMLWVLWFWIQENVFLSAWALIGTILLLLSTQALVVATIAILIRRAEIRIEGVVREQLEPPKLVKSELPETR